MLDQIIGQLTGNTETVESEPTLEDALTPAESNTDNYVNARGIENATERHLNEYEVNYDASILKSILVLDFSLTVTVNSMYSLFLLYALDGISSSFSPIPFHILSAAFNTAMGTALLSGKKIEKKYVIGMMVSRIGLTSSVNGVVLNKIQEKVDISRQTEAIIVESIKEFEGYQQPEQSQWHEIASGLLIAVAVLGIIGKIGLKFLSGGNTE